MNSGKRSETRKAFSNGPANGHTSRGKPRPTNRNANVTMEGVYGNSRFSYGVTSLIGCPVRVEVKNGSHYEGIFLTFSPKMEIVLQMAHRIEREQDGPYSKEQLIDAIIFKAQDVLSIIATNVDLDYATKDSFTDAAISKYNGEVIGRELERWDGDGPGGPGVDLSLETGANGWGVEDMFKTNAEKYNVKSSYDANLSAYTTVLEVEDTAEGRAKHARAARLASEIEGTDSYRQHVELENQDEGEAISAVIREQTPREPGTTERYIPPALRKQNAQPPRSKPPTVNGTNQGRETGSASPKQSASSATNSRNWEVVNDTDSEKDKNKKNLLSSASPTAASPSPNIDSQNSTNTQAVSDVASQALEESETKQASPARGATPHKPLQHSKSEHTRHDDHADFPAPTSSTSHHAKTRVADTTEHKKNGRDDLKAEISELRDFSDKFNIKLSTDSEKEKAKPQRATGQACDASPGTPEARTTPQKVDSASETSSTATEEQKDKKKSSLNPNAPEFTLNPLAREFKPSTSNVQVSTSPRPQTQSPVIQHIALHPSQHPQQMFPTFVTVNAPAMMPHEQQAKRASVSIRADPTAQALAATGTPLQAQPAGGMPTTPQYTLQPLMFGPNPAMQHNFAHGQGQLYNQQMVQMANNGHRLMNTQMGAQMAQLQYQHQHAHPQQMSQMANMNVQQQQQQIYIHGPGLSQAQPPPQMMQPNQQQHPQHYGAHPQHHGSRSTPPQQTSHPQNQAPQQQNPQQGQPHPQQQMYHHNGQIPPGSQPPLQPSPHTPASPQAQQQQQQQQQQQAVQCMPYFSQPPIPTQTHNPAMHQIATNYMQVAPQVSYTAHHAHGPPPHQNHVMMVQPHQHLQGQPHHIAHGPPQMQPQAQMQAAVHMQQSGHPMAGPQAGMTPMSQMHYPPQPSPR